MEKHERNMDVSEMVLKYVRKVDFRRMIICIQTCFFTTPEPNGPGVTRAASAWKSLLPKT
jgi:hypothetical protein